MTSAIFLHSISIIGFQVVLMRILSVNQWDHFASMIISIAMLGFGVSGTLLAITKHRLLRSSAWLVPLLMVMCSVFMLVAFRFSQQPYLQFDTFLVFSSGDQLMRLVVFAFLFFLPFFAGSLAIGMIYISHVSGIGRLYFLNLLGSGAGGIVALLLLSVMLPQDALVVCMLFPALAALLLGTGERKFLVVVSIALLMAGLGFNFLKPLPLSLSQYKALSRTLLLPDATITGMKTGASSLVHVVESDYLRYAPGLSLHFTGSIPVKPLVFVNGNAAGFIPSPPWDEKEDMLDFSTFRLPYLVSGCRRTAVISSGTGTLVAQALRNGAQEVHAFESDITLIKTLEEWHRGRFPSVYNAPGVTIHRMEARAFFHTDDQRYDLMILPTSGTFGGSSGLTAIKEDFTLTVEALQIYWDKLKPGGSLAITVYTDYPPRGPLKLIGSFVNLLKNNGIANPQNHVVAVRSWTSITLVVLKKPVSYGVSAAVRDFCEEMGFDPFILPDIEMNERCNFNQIDEEELFTITDAILQNADQHLVNDYLFCIDPPTDDKPYFLRFIRMGKIRMLLDVYRWRELPFVELGYIIVWLTFILALLLSALFILLPVIRSGSRGGKMPVLLYFGSIGLGFMFTEIILIQRFALYLGQPVYAVSAVLGIMLIASGAGSFLSSRLSPGTTKHRLTFVVIFVTLLLYALLLTPLLGHTAGVPILLKIMITFLVVSVPAFFMGMPFPLGLREVNRKYSDKAAWAWGINGFFSVLAAPLALIVAVETGSRSVLMLAAVSYLGALTALYIFRRKKT